MFCVPPSGDAAPPPDPFRVHHDHRARGAPPLLSRFLVSSFRGPVSRFQGEKMREKNPNLKFFYESILNPKFSTPKAMRCPSRVSSGSESTAGAVASPPRGRDCHIRRRAEMHPLRLLPAPGQLLFSFFLVSSRLPTRLSSKATSGPHSWPNLTDSQSTPCTTAFRRGDGGTVR